MDVYLTPESYPQPTKITHCLGSNLDEQLYRTKLYSLDDIK
jgi:hypothetical protein